MSNLKNNFHSDLIIIDHFDDIINQIDIKTETLLENQSLDADTRKELNEIRETQIERINELKEFNLSHLPQSINEEEYKEKWSHVITDTSLEYQHKIDQIKEELIFEDCVLWKNSNLINGFQLWITSWFYNEKNLEFLK